MSDLWNSFQSAMGSQPFLIGAALIVLAGLVVLVLRSGQSVFQFLIGIIPAAFLVAIWLASIILWWPAGWILGILGLVIPFRSIFSGFLNLSGRFSGNGFLDGDRKDFAERLWPPLYYPDLYRRVPEDIVRPLYEDGRLIGGYPISSLADRRFNESIYLSGMMIGVQAALVFLLVTLVPLLLGPLHRLFLLLPYFNGQPGPVVEHWPGIAPVRLTAQQLRDINVTLGWAKLGETVRIFLLSFPFDLLIAIGVALITGPLILNLWLRRATASYSFVTKDADVRWPFRIETRNMLRETYRRQVLHATGHLKNAPTYLVGAASGSLRVRGDLTAPMPHQPVKLDRESLFQHLLVFGGTGEGKTTAMLKPLLRQILADKSFGGFVADAKGVLWQDALRVARDIGREKDCILIGTAEGHFGVDVVAGLSPTQVSAALRSVLVQLGNNAGDSFWPDMAAGLLRQMLTLGQGYARTEAGQKESKRGPNPYSLWWAYQAVLRKEIASDAIMAIRTEHENHIEAIKAAETDQRAEEILAQDRALMTPELRDTIAYLESAWRDMAPDTKTGIIANVTQLLDGFAGSAALRDRFISGRSENTVSLDKALDGKLILNTLSSIEDGLPARLVSILLKTVLYRAARQRESLFKARTPPRSPQEKPCLVVMDEVQELATVDPSSGLSDASFWNVARSTGLAGIFATQTLAALNQSMGEDAAQNFVQQARSKVFFRTEERATVEYACWCAGEYERNRVFDDEHRESIEYRQLIDGWEPLATTDENEVIPADPAILITSAGSLVTGNAIRFESLPVRKAYEADTRFVPVVSSGGDPSMQHAAALAALQAQQAAAWRADDLTRQYRSQGNETMPALSASDVMNMGRWHAFAHIQRAGAVRQDIVVVDHDFS